MFLFACVLRTWCLHLYECAGHRPHDRYHSSYFVRYRLGVDYGIYMVSRIRDEVMGGMDVDDAIVLAPRVPVWPYLNTFW